MRIPEDEAMKLLERLRREPEREVIEFKSAETRFDVDRLGKYVSALANEANLRHVEAAWLLFGVMNNGEVCGTAFREYPGQLEKLKREISEGVTAGNGVREIHDLNHKDGRVLAFEIPPAPAGMPIAWKGQYCARDGESLTVLSPAKHDEIRRQIAGDWSAEVVGAAKLSDLDDAALRAARTAFAEHRHRVPREEIDSWDTAEFLETLGLLVDGKLTRAAILLGKANASYLLGQTMPEITWILSGEDRVYEHFGLPFLTVGDRVYERIRNYQIRLLQPGALIQTEVQKYDPQSILEAIHNCIAHMDYRDGARITLEEHPEKLVFENAGEFYDGEPHEYLLGKRRARKYRNPVLVEAMTDLNMIDRVGYGIRKIGDSQAKRFLPLPDYDLDPQRVQLTIYGAQIDENYSELLMQRTDLDLVDIFALDRVQKGLPIPPDAVKRLRQARLIEGRLPRLHISASLASATGTEAEYMKVRSIEDEHYLSLLLEYIEKFGPVRRADLDVFIWDKLHASMSDSQKSNKVKNLLKKLKARKQVEVVGLKRGARWQVSKTDGVKT